MSRTAATLFAVVFASNFAAAQCVVPGPHGPAVVPSPQPQRFIQPWEGQYPVHVTANKIVSVDPNTGAVNTQNRQIDNTAYQYGRNESQNNGTKRWVRRPVHNAQGRVIGYQEGWVWNNTYTGQEHGDLVSYTPNGLRMDGQPNQGRPNPGGVHENIRSYSVQPGNQQQPGNGRPQTGGIHENIRSFSPQQPGGIHKNIRSFSVQ